ncbi:MAG: M36 family metallopeptidase [Polyangiaceae bacterium]|nr:M36 family metallopeptidase [Polyangiaceae bacterium]
MKRSIRYSTLAAALLAGSLAHAADRPNLDVTFSQAPRTSGAVARGAADAAWAASAIVASTDEITGAPRFVWAPAGQAVPQLAAPTPESAARAHLGRSAALYGLPAAALETVKVAQIHDTGRGAIIVKLRQEVDGVELLRSDMSVVMRRNLELVALTGALHPSAVKGLSRGAAFKVSEAAALAMAFEDLYGVRVKPADMLDRKEIQGGYLSFDLATTPATEEAGLRFSRSARIKRAFFPLADRLVPAYYLELRSGKAESASGDAYAYVIAADDGRLLARENQTHSAFTYRVWADAQGDHTPLDGPQSNFTPHPTGQSDGSQPQFIPPILITTDGFNTNPGGGVDPWLPAGATQTLGNNVDAYADNAPDGFSPGDIRATTTAAGVFDRTYNTSLSPKASTNQIMAAVTQIFFVTNHLHDYYYDSGFDEAAGNAQQSNFGRGGIEGDPLQAQAQDYDGTNNANMSAGADGQPPVMQMFLWNSGGGVQRDGTIDNTIVAHEWGHYIHLRLVLCGTSQCGAQSEGMGDFIALMMVLREGDNLQGAYPLAIYATPALADAYFGIRRAPYSINPAINALSFRHITQGAPLPNTHPIIDLGNNAETHNAGEIWASMLFEAYVALVQAHPFAEAKRLMADYLVAGMKAAPPSPTYTEQRDAILAAAAANSTADFIAMANAFAKRGAGTCAVSPAADSQNFSGVVEDFATRPNAVFASAVLDDAVYSCDNDGKLDGQETGRLTVTVTNNGTADLSDLTGTVSTQAAGVSFPSGANVTFGTIPPFATGTATVEVALDGSFSQVQDLGLSLTLNSPASCAQSQNRLTVHRINLDDNPASSASDDVESDLTAWELTGSDADLIWAREVSGGANHLWHGLDVDGVTDTRLESPPLQVGDQPFSMTFTHRYKYEFSQGTYWDGSVIEISTDDGASWVDISTYGAPGYTGVISNLAGNPLMNRQGYVNQSAGYPGMTTTTINMGTALSGQTVKVRFRIGTDQAAGDTGWEIDDIGFTGILNTPFSKLSVDMATCTGVPIADAGPDQTVFSGDAVSLDASGSSDPDGDALTFAWTQVAGPSVTLSDATSATPGFTAPVVDADTTITMQVQVTDGQGASSDQVSVLVRPGNGGTGGGGVGGAGVGGGNGADTPPLVVDDGGCGCRVAGGDERAPAAPLAPLAPLAAAAALLLRRRRRS